MLSWMLYGAAVSFVLALAACVAERGLSVRKLPARWAWLAALLGSLALPAVVGFAPSSAPRVPAPPFLQPAAAARTSPAAPLAGGDGFIALPASWRDRMERPLGVAWLTLSSGFAATLLLSAWQLGRRRRGWARATVADTPVLVSDDLGPALVGLFTPAIVLPRWALDADGRTQELMVAHEREHLDAGDHRLLSLALGALVLMPWNAPLWWIVRRLRHAIELDCDRRVLRRGAESRAYGALLLRVSQGPAPGFAVVTPMLGEPVSYLERRIRAMSPRMPRHPRLLAGAAGAATGLGLWATFLLPRPAAAFPVVLDFVSVWVEPAGPWAESSAAALRDTLPPERIRAALAQWHPELLRAPDQRVVVYFIANREGVIQKSLVVPIAETEHGVVMPGPRPRPVRLAPGQTMVYDSTNSQDLPRGVIVPGRNVMAEIRADVAPQRIESVHMWTSHAVPGGLEVAWVTLR